MFATSGRARLAYESTGQQDGADVLLIHAGVNDRRSWRHVVERLGPRHRSSWSAGLTRKRSW